MTDQTDDQVDGTGDVDPYAGADGRLNDLFADQVGPEIDALLADPGMWESPSDGLGERIVSAIGSDVDGSASDEAPVARPSAVPGAVDPATSADDVDSGDVVVPLARRRSWSTMLLGAAAAFVVVLGGVVAFSALSDSPPQESFSADLVPTGLVPDVEGEVAVTETQSGLEIELDAASLPRRAGGLFYEGWLRTTDDRLVPIGTFHEGDGVTLWAGIELDQVASMTITLEEAVPGDSPAQASSGQVVLKLDFPQR